MTSLTVLIPTHGRPTLLRRTLDSLAECELPDGYVETVVAENGPKSGSEPVVVNASTAHPHLRLRYMHVERANKSHALNEALRTLKDGLVVFLDDDIVCDRNLLRNYAGFAAQKTTGYFFGGSLLCDYEEPPYEWLVPFLPYSAKGFATSDAHNWGFFLGANWAAYAEDIKRAGGFDPNFGPGSPTGARGQEKDMQIRLKKAGLQGVFIEEATIIHAVPAASCSPEWLLRRSKAMGRQQGLTARADSNRLAFARAVRGIPRTVLALLRSTRAGNIEKFRALSSWNHSVGFLLGFVLVGKR